GQKHAEFSNRGLPFLFSDNGLRRTWSCWGPEGSGRPCIRGLADQRRCLKKVRDLHNRRLKRAGIGLLVATGFFRGQSDRPADLSSDEEWDNEGSKKSVFEQILVIEKSSLRRGQIMIDSWLAMADCPSGR